MTFAGPKGDGGALARGGLAGGAAVGAAVGAFEGTGALPVEGGALGPLFLKYLLATRTTVATMATTRSIETESPIFLFQSHELRSPGSRSLFVQVISQGGAHADNQSLTSSWVELWVPASEVLAMGHHPVLAHLLGAVRGMRRVWRGGRDVHHRTPVGQHHDAVAGNWLIVHAERVVVLPAFPLVRAKPT